LGVQVELTSEELDALTIPGNEVNRTIAAMAGDTPVDLAHLIHLPDTRDAEIALTITNEFQQRG